MSKFKLNTVLLGLTALIGSGIAQAHDIDGVIDGGGNAPAFTVIAQVTCFDDGNGPASYLIGKVGDYPTNPHVDGMYVNLVLHKSNQAASTTDMGPRDFEYSQPIVLFGGNGVYNMFVSKTVTGARHVAVEYHCMTANNVHTGTGIDLVYAQ